MSSRTARRPNVLLITSDQQHWQTLGSNNPRIRTPALDRLAESGIRFDRGYCPNPTCTPTRASIITGMYPSTHGAFTLGTRLPEHVPTIGELLRREGYRSSLIGKAHFQPLTSTPDCLSLEGYPTLRDLNFWRDFNRTGTPWYGFDHVEITRNHGDEGHVGQHYGLWLEEHGLSNWQAYFQLRIDGIRDTEHDATLAPRVVRGPGYGWRAYEPWKLPAELHYTAWTGQRTIAAIEQACERQQPFFIWSSYHDPHPPYCVPDPWFSMYDPADMRPGRFVEGEFDRMPLPHRMTRDPSAPFEPFNADRRGNHGYHPHVGITDVQLRQSMAVYFGMISFMDQWIGRTLDRLRELRQLENTLVVFSSDHGHFLGQHGLVAKGPFHYEDVIRVPFIVSMPGTLPQGRTSDAIQSLVDLAPTFADVAGLDVPRSMQGVSQWEAWRDASSARDHAIVENHHQQGGEVHLRTLVTDRHKLTVYRGRDWGELFDLQHDPDELHNRFDDPAFRDVRESMLRKLIDADLSREPAPTRRVAGA